MRGGGVKIYEFDTLNYCRVTATESIRATVCWVNIHLNSIYSNPIKRSTSCFGGELGKGGWGDGKKKQKTVEGEVYNEVKKREKCKETGSLKSPAQFMFFFSFSDEKIEISKLELAYVCKSH